MDLTYTWHRGATETRLNTVRSPPSVDFSPHMARAMQPPMAETPLWQLEGNRRPFPPGDPVDTTFSGEWGELAQLNGGTFDVSFRPQAK